jgi:hypothetical protein
MAVNPVETLERLMRQSGDPLERIMGLGMRWSTEYHSIVEYDGA